MEKQYKEFHKLTNATPDIKLRYTTLWSKNQALWETSEVYPYLKEHSSELELGSQKRVLIPFCGTAFELKWFYEKGLEVIGVEFIEIPVRKFFMQHKFPYEVKELHGKKVYETLDKRLKIYVCNFFDIETEDVGKFDFIWDRFAQLAIKPNDREKYSKIMKSLCKEKFTYFLLTTQFEKNKGEEPDQAPIPVSHEKSKEMYGDWCNMKLIYQKSIVEDFPFLAEYETEYFLESFFLLTPK